MTFGLGLGLERLGIAAIKAPKLFSVLLFLLTVSLVSSLPSLGFDGDLLKGADRSTEVWQTAEELREQFDVTQPNLHIIFDFQNSDADIRTWLQQQQDLVFDLRLTDGVSEVSSLFSLRKLLKNGETEPLIGTLAPDFDLHDLSALQEGNPETGLFLSQQGTVSQIAVTFNATSQETSKKEAELFAEIKQLAVRMDAAVVFAGPTAAMSEHSRVLISDMTRMIILSIVVGWAIGLLVFDNIRPVLITNIVSPIAMIWTAGFAATVGIELDSVSVILPLLASVIAYADTVHLVIPLQKRMSSGDRIGPAMVETLKEIGPATVLTSITTGVAFGSVAFAGPEFSGLALLGVASVALAWISVITLCPLLCMAFARNRFGGVRFHDGLVQHWLGQLFDHIRPASKTIAVLSLLALVGLTALTSRAPSEHFPTDYIPQASAYRSAENLLQEHFTGSMATFVAMRRETSALPLASSEIDQLHALHTALEGLPGVETVWSRALLDSEQVSQLVDDAPDISKAQDAILLITNNAWSEKGSETLKRLESIKEIAAETTGRTDTLVTGPSIVVAETAIKDIDRLRTALALSAVFAVVLIVIMARSLVGGIAVGAAVAICVLGMLWLGNLLRDGVSYGLVVALIISVGIAIDDGVHVVNLSRQRDRNGPISKHGWRTGLIKAGLPMLISSFILIVTIGVTQFAEMPAIRAVGRDIMLALALALGLTLMVLPAVAIALREMLGNLKPRLDDKGLGG